MPNAPASSAGPAGPGQSFTAFRGHHHLASGSLDAVSRAVAAAQASPRRHEAVLVFEDSSGRQIDIDPRGTPSIPSPADAEAGAPRAPGRPKLGVVAREVTLLPRHWEWLSLQPGGASVALRKLVEEARRAQGGQDALRAAQERCYRFVHAIAGDLPGYEEALRALFGGQSAAFHAATASWPDDIRLYALA
ncbi:MAG TPA: DUF2239 family protein, partial [Albitalea sp.]|nr:DUF2239 family protein [Albitalea sp.]